MKISYCITACDEAEELKYLLTTLMPHIQSTDEVILLIDDTKSSKEVWEIAKDTRITKVFTKPLNRDFASFKNFFFSIATGDYIFQLDADEFLPDEFIESLPKLLETHSDIDLFLVPRINIVEGITEEHIKKWKWNYDVERRRINFPDYQTRIYRNVKEIYWQGKVHESITGFKTYSMLPQQDEWCLYHYKTIERQEKQNQFYDSY